MSRFEAWSLAVQIAGALGALLVVVVALWGEYFRTLVASPRLRLRLRSAEGELTKFSDGTPARYYHLVVSNTRNWIPARNVLVFLVGLERPGPDCGWQSSMATGPIPLNWQFGAFAPGLPTVGAERICDLGRVPKGGPFEVLTPFKPNNFDGALRAGGRLRVQLMAVAENAIPKSLAIEVSWDGTWADGANEMLSHLVIKEVPSSSTAG